MRPHFDSSATRPSPRCFRTTADGRIPLATDWPALWAAAQQLPRTVVQTRHTSARLVAVGPLPALHPDRAGTFARFEAGSLELRLPYWAQAWGRLEPCMCCGSPGRIEILNTAGAEFLQLCAAPECPLPTWSDVLNRLAPASTVAVEPPALAGGACLPLLADDAELVSSSPESLVPLLAGLADANVAIRCTLITGEARHERVFRPDYVAFSGGLLTTHGDNVTSQLALPAVTALAAELTATGWSLHAAGPGGTQLLTFSAASEPVAARAWSAALASAYSELR